MEFSRQEYWHGLPFPPPGDLPNPGIEPRSPALQADSLLSEPPGKPELKNGTLKMKLQDDSLTLIFHAGLEKDSLFHIALPWVAWLQPAARVV